jgi:DNA-binding transcriptional LysR family regulator
VINYGEVDLNLLLVLERVLAHENVAAAAEDLGLSPSATSRALQRLREAIGDPLFVRAGNRLVPTERARALAGPTARAIEAARSVFQPSEGLDPALATGDFVLTLGDELQQALFPSIVARVQAVWPGIDLRVRALWAGSADEERRDLVHLAIAPDLTALPTIVDLPDVDDLVHQPLYVRRFVVVGARAAWPVAPDLDRYVAAEHVIMSDEGGSRGFMDELLHQHGRTRRVACSVTSFGAVAEVVRATRLLALVPSEILPTLGRDLVAHPPPLPVPSMAMTMVWHPRYTTQARHRALRALVAEVVRSCVR